MASRREDIEPPEKASMVKSLARNWTDEPISFVRNFTNLVYKVGASRYLRVTHEAHRSETFVQSEVELLRSLGASNFPASQPVASLSGAFVHSSYASDGRYFAVLFDEAPGRPFDVKADVANDALFFELGKTMGSLHNLLTEFKPSPVFSRFDWHEDRWSKFKQIVPKSELAAWSLYDDLMTWTVDLPRSQQHFGLIHGDFTVMNIRFQNGQASLFDFDAACAHWRSYEIATFLHMFGPFPQAQKRRVYDRVLGGYAATHRVDDELLRQVSKFAHMRLLYSYLVFAEEWGFANLSAEQEAYFDVRRGLFEGPPIWPVGGS